MERTNFFHSAHRYKKTNGGGVSHRGAMQANWFVELSTESLERVTMVDQHIYVSDMIEQIGTFQTTNKFLSPLINCKIQGIYNVR